MSDLSMYELEDIISDEFDQTDDRIVPHCSNKYGSEHSLQGDSCKKPRREVRSVSSISANSVGWEKEERSLTTCNKKRNMLGKDPWPDTPDVVFSDLHDGDAMKEVASLASDNKPVLNDRFASVSRGSYDYSLGQISQDDDLSFFDNDCEGKESSDLLYYNWPDIGNFEDVDRMFRSCDSSFGLGVTGSEDELGWFSLAGPIEDSIETLKSDFKFTSPLSSALKRSEDHEPPRVINKSLHCILESKDEFKPKQQQVLHKKQSKHQNQSEGKRKHQWRDKASSFYYTGDTHNNDEVISSMDTVEVVTSIGNRQQRQNLEPSSFHYLQNRVPYVLPDQATVGPILPGVKVENKGLISHSSKESSYGSSQLQSVESSIVTSFDVTAIKLDEERENVNHPHGSEPLFTGNARNVGMMVQASICNPPPFQKQVHQSTNEIDSQSDIEGGQVGVFQEKDARNAPEGASMNSRLDETSLEATSFRQLQQVMEQLDLRTKLCIRDSLYRLARSAEQRHNYENLGRGYADGSLTVEGTNKCTGFIDMETDTNPIDRSIAHLLFHRPSETRGAPAQNPLQHKSNSMIHGSITNPPLMAEKLVCQEENANESDDKMAEN